MRFARDLRLLRDEAGSPTYRELSARAHYSPAALSDAASGRRLPTLAVAMAYVAACGGDTAVWETRWRSAAAELAARRTDVGDGDRPPYVGLASFQQEDADRFFGREALVADLLDRLRRRRFLAVLGPSGCGKSSLLRAGLVPRLTGERNRRGVVVFTPGQHPVEECAVHLAGPLDESPATLYAELSSAPRNLQLRLREAVAEGGADFVLVVDQFEELFTLCGDERERASFIDALVTAATDPRGRATVVLGVRADFLGHCGQHPRLVEALRDAQVLVGPMTTDELRTAITGPAERAGYRVETALVTRLVADASRQAGMLPLISHALLQTWLRRQGTVMTMAGYDATGGIEHALARSAEEVYQALDEDQQHLARQIFLRLTALGEGTEDTKRRTARAELAEDAALVLETLARKRLVTVGHGSVEIAHEALIRHWPRLRDWLAEDREGHRLQRRLTEAATEWERGGRDEGVLYRGARLTAWQDRPLDQLNDTERAFLAASRHAAAGAHRSRRRRVWWTIGGLSATTVVVTVLAVVAMVLAARAEDGRTLAVGRQLVADARAQLQVDPELGLLLAREAYARAPNDDTESVLRQAVADSHVRATLSAHSVGPSGSRAVSGVAFSPDGRHLVLSDTGGAFQVWDWHGGRVTRPRVLQGNLSIANPVFSPDGADIAAASPSGVVLVRDWAHGGRPVTLPGDQGEVSSVAFSPDGQRLASGGHDGTVWLRNTAGDGGPVVLPAHDGRVSEVAFGSDGRLVSSGADGAVRVWDLAGGGTSATTLSSPEGGVAAVAFRRDGRVASAAADGTVRTWDPSGANGSVVLGFHNHGAHDVAYSGDGHWVVSVGVDPAVRVWNADHPAEPVVLRGHRGAVTAATFSQDGRTVVSASLDGTAKVWAVDEVEDVTVRHGHRGPVTCVAPSPDGRRVASGGHDGTVRVWDVAGDSEPLVLPGPGGPVEHLTFSQDGRYLAAATGGTVFVWHTRDPGDPVRLGSPEWPLAGIAFGPDGDQLTAANPNDGSLRIWDVPRTGRAGPPTTVRLPGSPYALLGVAWSPDGRHLATATGDTVLLWELSGRRAEPVVLDGHQGLVRAMAFSHDGTRLVSVGDDGTVQLWDLTDGSDPTVLHGKQDVVWNAAHSGDGRHLVTSGSDNTVRIWDTDSAGEPLVLDGFRATVLAVAPLTGERYVTAHGDGTVRTWRCPSCGDLPTVLAGASRHRTRELTERERQTFLHKGS